MIHPGPRFPVGPWAGGFRRLRATRFPQPILSASPLLTACFLFPERGFILPSPGEAGPAAGAAAGQGKPREDRAAGPAGRPTERQEGPGVAAGNAPGRAGGRPFVRARRAIESKQHASLGGWRPTPAGIVRRHRGGWGGFDARGLRRFLGPGCRASSRGTAPVQLVRRDVFPRSVPGRNRRGGFSFLPVSAPVHPGRPVLLERVPRNPDPGPASGAGGSGGTDPVSGSLPCPGSGRPSLRRLRFPSFRYFSDPEKGATLTPFAILPALAARPWGQLSSNLGRAVIRGALRLLGRPGGLPGASWAA